MFKERRFVFKRTESIIDEFVSPGEMLATESNQDEQTELLQSIAGFVTEPYDYIALTYVAAGNGVGEIETAVYRSGGSGGVIVATITITYNAANKIATVTRT